MQRFSRSSYDSNFGSDRLGSVDGCELSIDRGDSRIRVSVIHGWPVHGRPAMLTRMTETDWALVVQLFREARSRRGDKGRDDRNFLEALQYFVVHNITWRALPPKFGPWNSIWKRFWRLSRSGTFEAFFAALAATSKTAHLVQMFDSPLLADLTRAPTARPRISKNLCRLVRHIAVAVFCGLFCNTFLLVSLVRFNCSRWKYLFCAMTGPFKAFRISIVRD